MKRFAAILICMLLFTTAFAVGGADKEGRPRWADSLRSVYLYTEAVKQRTIYERNDVAQSLLYEAIEADSSFAPAYFQLAALRRSQSPEEALRLARKAYQLDTANVWYMYQYGGSLVEMDRYAEALPIYQRLFESHKEPNNYLYLAGIYDQLGQHYSAITVLDSAEVRFGRIPQLTRIKRRLLLGTNQIDRAIEEEKRAAAEAPYELEPHALLAELYSRKGLDSLAMSEFQKALAIDSLDLMTLMGLADHYNMRKDFDSMLKVNATLFAHKEMPLDEKLRLLKSCISDRDFYREHYFAIDNLISLLSIHHPTDPRVVSHYADHLIASGKLDQALELYKIHLDDEPPQEDYLLTIIDIESYLERPDSVERYVKLGLERYPNRVELHLAGGNVLYRQKRYQEAVKAYLRTLDHTESDSLRSVVWGQVGDVYHQQADEATNPSKQKRLRKQSYEAYAKALTLNPDNVGVLNNWAYFLSLEEQELERALQMATRVVELTNHNPTYLDTQAWVLFKMGRIDEARTIQRRAVALDGQKSLELLVHYGDILFASGSRFMAETYWKRALDRGYDKDEIERRLAQPNPQKPTAE